MDTKTELLRTVVNSLINEDNAAASEAFSQYATLKARGILEGESADTVAVEVPVVESETDETDVAAIAKEILDSEKPTA